MTQSKLVGLLFEAWSDLDRAIEGLNHEDAVKRHFDGSSFAWTYVHTANQVDAWVNMRFQKKEPNPLTSRDRFGLGGKGEAADWQAIRDAVGEVRLSAKTYLESRTDDDLEETVEYTGSFSPLQGKRLSLRYALYRAISHHYFHIGEIASKRDILGHSVGDYPGSLGDAI